MHELRTQRVAARPPRRSGPAADPRWEAVRTRDRAADGRFVYAVRSTGIFCRPSCPSRRPRPDRVAFYATPHEAAAAGFRPCRRCRPTAAAPATLAERVRAYLDAHPGERVTLADLATALGAGRAHLQRAFTQAYGESPRAYAERLRAGRFRAGLRAGQGVSRAAFEAGYGSLNRAYAGAARHLGMTPGRYARGGAGMTLEWCTLPSSLGTLLVARSAQGICAVLPAGSRAEAARQFAEEFPRASLVEVPPFAAARAAARAVEGRGAAPALDLHGTDFQRRVWATLAGIPAGETRTYADVARAIGRPSAARAVARAVATNPVAVLVPCHRVVRGDGGMGGYRWGVARKAALLAREAGD